MTLLVDVRRPASSASYVFDAATGWTGVAGASGAGKSQLLRLLAGLDEGQGKIHWRDQRWLDRDQSVPARCRGVAMVFQGARLFPHRTLAGNLALAARGRGDGGERDSVVSALGLESCLQQWPNTLSGGQRQRANLAMALLSRPQLLLLDEPFSGLDRPRRTQILRWLRPWCDARDMDVMLVSHDIADLASVCDQLLVIEAGSVSHAGAVTEVLNRPAALALLGQRPGVVWETSVAAEGGLVLADGLSVSMPRSDLPIGQRVRLHVLASDVILSASPLSQVSLRNQFPVRVERVDVCGDTALVALMVASRWPLLASVTERALTELSVRPGQALFALVKATALESWAV